MYVCECECVCVVCGVGGRMCVHVCMCVGEGVEKINSTRPVIRVNSAPVRNPTNNHPINLFKALPFKR